MALRIQASNISEGAQLFGTKENVNVLCKGVQDIENLPYLRKLFWGVCAVSGTCGTGLLSLAYLGFYRSIKVDVLGSVITLGAIGWIRWQQSAIEGRAKIFSDHVDSFVDKLKKAHEVASWAMCCKINSIVDHNDNLKQTHPHEFYQSIQKQAASHEREFFDQKIEFGESSSGLKLPKGTAEWRTAIIKNRENLELVIQFLEEYFAPSKWAGEQLAKVKSAAYYVLNGHNEDEEELSDKRSYYVDLDKSKFEATLRPWLS